MCNYSSDETHHTHVVKSPSFGSWYYFYFSRPREKVREKGGNGFIFFWGGGGLISGAVWLLLPCWCWCIADSCSVNLCWVPPGPHLLWGLRKCNFALFSPRTLKTNRVCCRNFPLQEGGIFPALGRMHNFILMYCPYVWTLRPNNVIWNRLPLSVVNFL